MERTQRRNVIAAGLAAAVLLVGFLVVERVRLGSDVGRLNDKLEAIRGDASAEITLLEDANAELDSRLSEVTAERDSLNDSLAETEAARAALDEQLAAVTAERDEALATTDELSALLGPDGQIVRMPDLLGSTLDEARQFTDSIGARLVVSEADPINVIARPDTIITQLPEPETALPPGAAVWVEVFVQAETSEG